jgi:hypothetical protein
MTETLLIEIARIAVGPRLRGVDAVWVDILAESIREHGLVTPVHVGVADDHGQHMLIAGAHRLAAMVKLGKRSIPAAIFEGNTLAARLLEIDENLMRLELSVLDRGVFLAERKIIWDTLHPEKGHGGDRVSASRTKMSTCFERYTIEAGRRLKKSDRTVSRLISRAQRIAPDVQQRIAFHPVSNLGRDLDLLAQLPADEQRGVVEFLFGADAVSTVAAAILKYRGEDKEAAAPLTGFDRLVAAWGRASAEEQRGFVHHLRASRRDLFGENP